MCRIFLRLQVVVDESLGMYSHLQNSKMFFACVRLICSLMGAVQCFNYALYHGCLFLRGSFAAPDARISSRSREKRFLHRGYIGEPMYILTTLRNKKKLCSNLRIYPPRLLHILQFYDRTHKPCTVFARNSGLPVTNFDSDPN